MKRLFLFGSCLLAVQGALAKETPTSVCETPDECWTRGRTVYRWDADSGIMLLKRACESDQREACGDLSAIYEQGAGVPADLRLAMFYAERSCALGQKWICGELGRMLAQRGADMTRAINLLGDSCEADYAPACQYLGLLQHRRGQTAASSRAFQKACEGGVGEACNHLGALASKGQWGELSDSLRLYDQACSLNAPTGCRNLARAFLQLGDSQAARKAAERGCALQDGPSCALLGTATERSGSEGSEFYAQACELHSASGCAHLCRALQKEKKNQAAREACSQACELGDGPACDDLGQMILQENPQNPQALVSLERGCDLKDAVSCYDLGLALQSGPQRQPARAPAYLERACKLNEGRACNDLAVSLLNLGSVENEIKARPYLKQACDLGVGQACRNLALLHRSRGEEAEAGAFLERACALGEKAACP